MKLTARSKACGGFDVPEDAGKSGNKKPWIVAVW